MVGAARLNEELIAAARAKVAQPHFKKAEG
jgi:hypothetical protein